MIVYLRESSVGLDSIRLFFLQPLFSSIIHIERESEKKHFLLSKQSKAKQSKSLRQKIRRKRRKMDPTGCPEGYATDSIFEPIASGVPCGTPLVGFWVGTSCILLVKLSGFIGRMYIRAQRRALRQTSKLKHNLPLGLILDFVAFCVYFILYTLAGTNHANYANGIAFSLYSLSFLPFAIGFTVLLFRTVRLGGKILPLKGELAPPDELKSFNRIGKFFVSLQIFSLFASSVVLIICAPIMPQYEPKFVIAGFIFKASFMIFTGLGIINQLQRCLGVIGKISGDIVRNLSQNNQVNIEIAVRRMRYNQILVAIIALPIAIVLILLGSFCGC